MTARAKWIKEAVANGSCAHCGTTEDLCADHIVPRLLGGRTNRQNIQILCRRCNSKKGHLHPDDMTPTAVQEKGLSGRRYFSQIPHMVVDDPRICPFGLALYLYYKRIASEDGACYRSQETITKETGIGRTKIAQCRKALADMGYIEVEHRHLQSTRVTIVDVWSENESRYVRDTAASATRTPTSAERTQLEPPHGHKEERTPEEELVEEQTHTPSARERESSKPIDDEFYAAMVRKHADDLGGPAAVHEAIADALNHKAADKRKSKRLYVQGWLRRECEFRKQREVQTREVLSRGERVGAGPGGPRGTAGTRVTDGTPVFAKYG